MRSWQTLTVRASAACTAWHTQTMQQLTGTWHTSPGGHKLVAHVRAEEAAAKQPEGNGAGRPLVVQTEGLRPDQVVIQTD